MTARIPVIVMLLSYPMITAWNVGELRLPGLPVLKYAPIRLGSHSVFFSGKCAGPLIGDVGSIMLHGCG